MAAQTGGPSGARERETAARTVASDILPQQIAFGAAACPGLRFATPEDDEREYQPAALGSGVCIERLAGTPTLGVRAAPAAWPGFMNFTSTR